MEIPTVICPYCGEEIIIKISDEDIIKLIAQRLGVEVECRHQTSKNG